MVNIKSSVRNGAEITKIKLKKGIKLSFRALNILIIAFMIMSLFPIQHISVFIAELVMYCVIIVVVNVLYKIIMKLIQKSTDKAKVPEITNELEDDIAYIQFKKNYYNSNKD